MTQKDALDILKLGRNVYLTGSAGSGKTYLLNTYIKYLADHNVDVAITASTGIAASHMNGVTIHSWSGLGIRDNLTEYDLEAMEEKRYLWERFAKTKVLIIDEISMLHDYRLDLVERVVRFFKRNEEVFGGMQVILCGDFFQLPPVRRGSEPEARFVYHSAAWEALNLKICYLTESHRHEDQDFISVLNAIRTNTVDEKTLDILRTRQNKELDKSDGVEPTKLYTHNIDVDAINTEALEKVVGQVHTYTMEETGIPALVASLKASCLAPERLVIKKGAQVMFVKNNYEGGYVNGTLGTVVSWNEESVNVRTVLGKMIIAVAQDWTIEDGGATKAKISQIPLRLAWAITVHKSQGMTLDAAEIDLGKAFEKGMGYVALSRVRSLAGLKLISLNKKALEINESILAFDEELQEDSRAAVGSLEEMGAKEKERRQKEFLGKIAPTAKVKKEKKISTFEQTKTLILKKMSLQDIVEKRKLKAETIIEHIEKMIEADDLGARDIFYLKEIAFSTGRFEKIAEAFAKTKSNTDSSTFYLAPVKQFLGTSFSFAELRLARLFL